MTTPSDTAETPALLAHRSFVMFWCARTATVAAYMMMTVAVGWQIYDLTGQAFDLGLVGLVQFIPFVALFLVIGQVVDRYDRRSVARICQIVKAAMALTLAAGTAGGWLDRDVMLAVVFVTGVARAFEVPTLLTMIPGLVPQSILPRALAASATANQTATIAGPAIGMLVYSYSPLLLYAICTACFVLASVLVSLIRLQGQIQDRKRVTIETLFAGFSYIRSRPIVLGAISLDLFVVLLGGVTALLPIFARDILETGPWGLGLLRSAPAIGALTVSIILARTSIDRRVGPILFLTTAVFGLSILVFALSTSLVISIIALAIYGGTDAVSVVIRHSLVQLQTPNDMLGRVMSINSMFTGTSSTLGEFRAGAVAAGFGVVPSVLLGSVGALVVVALWMKLFPDLVRVDAMQPREASAADVAVATGPPQVAVAAAAQEVAEATTPSDRALPGSGR